MAAPENLLLLQLTLVMVLGSAGLVQADYEPVPHLKVWGRSFMLESKVTVVLNSGSVRKVYKISEYHSAWQKRSKLHYSEHGPDPSPSPVEGRATIYATDQGTLMVSPRRNYCTLLEKNWLDHLLNANILDGFDSEHLIGTARLLWFIERNFEQFKLTLTGANFDSNSNSDALTYSAELVNGKGGKFSIGLYYKPGGNANLPHGIPRRIVIVTASLQLIEYEIDRFKDLWSDKLQLGTSSKDISVNRGASGAMDLIAFDIFSLDRAAGCSSQVANSHKDLEALIKEEKFRFSFNARPEAIRGLGPIDLTVAYEPHLAVLRLNIRQPTRTVSTLTDYERNRKFHIVKKRPNVKQDPVFDQIVSADPNSRSCVVSRAKAEHGPTLGHRKNPFTLGRVLLGTNRMTYLGLAYVRGIETRVYESDNCDWPVWLEQPAIFKEVAREKLDRDSKEELKMRDGAKIIKDRGFSLTNVFYFSNANARQQDAAGDDDFQLDASRLLLVEVFTRIDRTGAILSRNVYPIYDFAWDLPSFGPAAGERYEDLFSLKDDCLAEMDDNEQATINLLLESELTPNEKSAWLQERSKRNLALISMAQSELSLMSAMIYDTESRLLVVDDDSKLNDASKKLRFKVEASFRVAQRSKAMAELVYLGRALLKQQRVRHYKAFNFEMCHMMASHQKLDTIFAFGAPENDCYLLDFLNIGRVDLDNVVDEIFLFTDTGLAEVYKISHQKKIFSESADDINRLVASRNRMDKMNAVLLFNPAERDVALEDPDAKIPFQIATFRMDTLNDEVSYDLDNLHWSGANKFPGLGLEAPASSNTWAKRVESKFISDPGTKNYHQETMSFEFCQTACLADLSCQSYSVCLRGGTVQCILSSVAFATPEIVSQLMQFAAKKSNFGDKLELKLDPNEQSYITDGLKQQTDQKDGVEQFVEVVKHPTCELHNKIFRNLFTITLRAKSAQVNSITEPVTNLEKCAKLCYQKTLDFMRREARQPTEATEASSRGARSESSGKICDHFHYVDHMDLAARNPTKAKQIQKHFSEIGQNLPPVGGYCVLPGQPAAKQAESNADDLLKEWLKLDRYDFDYLSLYAKQRDVSLAQTERTLDEELALSMIGKSSTLSRPLVIRQNENFGSIHRVEGNPAECAKRCFEIKSRTAFPVCRSFDFVERTLHDLSVQKFCAFHSVTMRWSFENERFDLVKRGSDRQQLVKVDSSESVKVTHYEPREGIVAQTLDEFYKIELASDMKAIKRQLSSPRTLYMHSFALLCTTVLTLTLGVSLGFVLGAKVLHRLATDRELGESLVVEQLDEPKAPAITFSNLVDSEGKIVGQR